MKNIVDKISRIFSVKSRKTENMNVICRNATGELGTYCTKEYNK